VLKYFQPWWTWLVSTIPLTIAPNFLTIVGLAVNIITSLILIWFSPGKYSIDKCVKRTEEKIFYCPADAKSEAPSIVYLLCAVGLFIYQSLDAIDGKQARRTNSSSPLGELFDHG
jgi:phosphatidylglycerophosphate synthase